VAPGLS